MSIETFIRQDILAPRLARRGVLVVYDPQHRYRAVCHNGALAAQSLLIFYCFGRCIFVAYLPSFRVFESTQWPPPHALRLIWRPFLQAFSIRAQHACCSLRRQTVDVFSRLPACCTSFANGACFTRNAMLARVCARTARGILREFCYLESLYVFE